MGWLTLAIQFGLLIGPALAGTSTTLLSGTMQAYLPVLGEQQPGLPPEQVGCMTTIQAVASGLARIPGGQIVDRPPRRILLIVCGPRVYAVAVAALPPGTIRVKGTLRSSALDPSRGS